MVRSAHVGHDGEVYAYVECDAGHVHRVGTDAFHELRGGCIAIETCCHLLRCAQRRGHGSNPVRPGGANHIGQEVRYGDREVCCR